MFFASKSIYPVFSRCLAVVFAYLPAFGINVLMAKLTIIYVTIIFFIYGSPYFNPTYFLF